ncbi:MAG: sulfatase [Candidatus Hydrogenedentes bacterium]|nr:sulfatase [Candidatus Hydrogenedentota bacterium]
MRLVAVNRTLPKAIAWTGAAFTTFGLLAIWSACVGGCTPEGEQVTQAKPTRPTVEPASDLNVLLITSDALRADRLGVYGHERETSPALDALAESGVLFEYAMAQRGETAPSLASLMTSQYPIEHGVRRNGDRFPFSPKSVMLVEHLKAHGYVTGAALGNCQPAGREFDEWFRHQGDDVSVTRSAIKWLNKNKDNRFFLWLHYFKPHYPFIPPPGYRKMFADPEYKGTIAGDTKQLMSVMLGLMPFSEEDRIHVGALYDGSVRFINDQVDRVLAEVEKLGLSKNTLIVFTADHGEGLYDRQNYFFHSASTHECVLHIPLIFAGAGVQQKGVRVSDVVESIDVAPTILEILGLPAPDSFSGTSLLPAFRGEKLELGPAFSEYLDLMLSIRTDTHRFLWNPTDHIIKIVTPTQRKRQGLPLDIEALYVVEQEELFATPSDPKERHNLIEEQPALAEELRKKLLEWKEAHSWEILGAIKQEIPEETAKELEAMGYL